MSDTFEGGQGCAVNVAEWNVDVKGDSEPVTARRKLVYSTAPQARVVRSSCRLERFARAMPCSICLVDRYCLANPPPHSGPMQHIEMYEIRDQIQGTEDKEKARSRPFSQQPALQPHCCLLPDYQLSQILLAEGPW